MVDETPKEEVWRVIGFLVLVCAVLLVGHAIMSQAGKPRLVVTGTVTDAATGAPITGAGVSDDTYGPKPHRGTVTDASGVYRYTTWPEEHTVIAEATGYVPLRQTLSVGVTGTTTRINLDFQLQPVQTRPEGSTTNRNTIGE